MICSVIGLILVILFIWFILCFFVDVCVVVIQCFGYIVGWDQGGGIVLDEDCWFWYVVVCEQFCVVVVWCFQCLVVVEGGWVYEYQCLVD